MSTESLLLALTWYVVFLLSTVCHEAAHALTAYRLGDPTAYRGGQVSLSPLPHIRREPFGTVVVPLLSLLSGGGMIGWASAPFDPVWATTHPRRAALMALAGPAANLALLVLCACVLRAGVAMGVFGVPMQWIRPDAIAVAPDGLLTVCMTILSVAFSLNLTLALLNLMPVPPLDGGAALPLFMSVEGGRRYQGWLRASPAVALVGFLVVWQVFGGLQRTIFTFAVSLLWYPLASYR